MKLKEQRNANKKGICSVWFVKPDANLKEYLVLQRKPVVPIPPKLGGKSSLSGYGQQFTFHENGEMDDSYSAPCGMDEQIHRWSGKWRWDEEKGLLFLQVEKYPEWLAGLSTVRPSEAYKKGQEFKVIEMTEQTMRLRLKNASEPLWKYERYRKARQS